MKSFGYTIFDSIFSVLSNFFTTFYTLQVQGFRNTAFLIVIFYVVIVGYNLIRGNFGEKSKTATLTIFLVPLFYGIAFNTSMYIEWVYNPIINTMFSLSSFYISSGEDSSGMVSVFDNLDKVFGKLMLAIDTMSNKPVEGWGMGSTVKVFFIALALGLVFGALYAVFVTLMIWGFFAIHIMLLVGIFPLFFAAFKETRHIFFAWLKAVIAYMLIPVFTAIIMSLTMFFVATAIDDIASIDPNQGVFTASVGGALLVGVLSIFFHMKAPEFANALTGGQSSGISGLAGSVGAIGMGGAMLAQKSGMTGGMSGAGKWAAGAAGNKLDKMTGGKVSSAYRSLKGLSQ